MSQRATGTFACLTFTLLAACTQGGAGEGDAPRVPNVILIVADDLGFADVGYQGGLAATPNIDALAREGVVLERFYVQPICSPTRAALMTGRDPLRIGLGRAALAPWRRAGLNPAQETLAEALGAAGYGRRALFGKWHLGHLERSWHPLSQGFTRFRGHYNGAIDYFEHTREGQRDWHEGFEPLEEEGYSTDLIADAAARFVAAEGDGSPFLCVVSFNAPHAPMQVPRAWSERYAELAGPNGETSMQQVMAGMIGSMDAGIGRILSALEESGAARDTLVWFLSDNGGIEDLPASNAPLRGDKGTVLEGGVRVPSCVRWPAAIPAASRLSEPTAVLDVLPTLQALAGGGASPRAELDGLDLGAALRGTAPVPERELFFYMAMEGDDTEQLAIRTPRWKLVVLGPSLAREPLGDAHLVLLFDVEADPEERLDRAAEEPALVQELAAKLVAFRRTQPADAIAPYAQGREGFTPPRDWRIPE